MSTEGQSSHEPRTTPPSLGALGSVLVFGGFAVLLWSAIHLAIPLLQKWTSLEPVVLWFIAGGCGVFAPMLIVSYLLLRRENNGRWSDLWRDRLRFHRMSREDWLWSLAGLVTAGLLCAGAGWLLHAVWGTTSLHPSFLQVQPLGPGRYWILAAWLPFWLLNILGEEILWRGVILPRQEQRFGCSAWIWNSAGWLLFHWAFGLTLVAMLAPITLVLPYVVQRRQNSWTGVVIHAGLNGPGFVAVAFGIA